MSFAMTTDAIRDHSKTVTRRPADTWTSLKVGDRLLAVDKAMGLKKGETSKILAVIRIVDVRVEPLSAITQDDVQREGLPDVVTPSGFVQRFATAYNLTTEAAGAQVVRRIEFTYLEGQELIAALGEVRQRQVASRKARERKNLIDDAQFAALWEVPR